MLRLALTLVFTVALASAVAAAYPVPASAAIPCEAQPALAGDAPATPMAQSGSRTVEDILAGDGTIPPATPQVSPAASPGTSVLGRAQGPTENIVRCLLYGDLAGFATLLTPEFRASRLGVTSADEASGMVAEVGSIRLLGIGDATATGTDRFRADARLLVGNARYLEVTLEYVLVEDLPYLATSQVNRAVDVTANIAIALDDDAVTPASATVEASAITLLEVDHAGGLPMGYVLTAADGEVVREGRVDPDSYAGPPDDSVTVLVDLAPGEYLLTFTPRGNPSAPVQEIVITVAA